MVKLQIVKIMGFLITIYKDDGETTNSENTGIFSIVNASPPHS